MMVVVIVKNMMTDMSSKFDILGDDDVCEIYNDYDGDMNSM